jgi:hypothetical protein
MAQIEGMGLENFSNFIMSNYSGFIKLPRIPEE